MRQGGAYFLYFIYYTISKPDAVVTDKILFIPQSEYDPSLTSRPSKSVQTNGSTQNNLNLHVLMVWYGYRTIFSREIEWFCRPSVVCVKVNIYFGIFMAKYSMDAGGVFLHFIFMAIDCHAAGRGFLLWGSWRVMRPRAAPDTNRKSEWWWPNVTRDQLLPGTNWHQHWAGPKQCPGP